MGKKVIMLGNEAIARGAYEAGVKVSAAYPGTPSTEISESLVQYRDDLYCEWSPNEKVATEVAIGASVSGVRAMACMKHVGFNVAADPAYTVSYMGVNGGLVIVVADDPGLYSSQNEQDTRMVARAAQLPVLEPSDSSEAKEYMKLAFELSEKFDRPFVFRTTTRLAHSQGLVELGERECPEDKPYVKNIQKTVMMPGNAKLRHVEIEKRNLELQEAADTLPINTVEMNDTKIGVITSGIPYQYVKEALPNASVLKLGMVNPLPRKMIEEFASKVEKLYIVEELDPVIEEQVKSWGIQAVGKEIFTVQGEYSANMIRAAIGGEKLEIAAPAAAPGRPPILCPGCPQKRLLCAEQAEAACCGRYRLLYTGSGGASQRGGYHHLYGSQHFQSPRDGESQGQRVHQGLGGSDRRFHLLTYRCEFPDEHDVQQRHRNGDHPGQLYYGNDRTSGSRGHRQDLQGDPTYAIDIPGLCRAMGVKNVVEVNAFDIETLEKTVKEEVARDEVSVIITKTPCVLLSKAKKPLYVAHEDKCKKCGMCMKPGCPAMTKNPDGTIHIDDTMCTGCGLCASLCKFDAIELVKEGER